MRLFIVILSVVLLGCSPNQPKKMKLPYGSYFTKSYHEDTIQFHKLDGNSVITSSSELLYWEISKDSIFQRDTRGQMRFFGNNKCSYFISSDTLTIVYLDDFKEKYLILQSNDTLIELIDITEVARKRIFYELQFE